jgi:hypothetical protein
VFVGPQRSRSVGLIRGEPEALKDEVALILHASRSPQDFVKIDMATANESPVVFTQVQMFEVWT